MILEIVFFVFTEVWNRTLNHGTIAVVELTKSFQYIRSREVLTEPFHLSYPYVFKYNNSYYMLPEAWESKQLRLYKSKCFPWSWELHSILINDIDYADPTLCIFNDMFYIILNSDPLENSQTELYFSKNITGKWRKHSSLIQIRNPSRSSRSAGKLLSLGNKTYRFTQDCHKKYGMGVNVTEILEISPKSYHQNELNIINLERPYWALSGFHHVDVFKNKNHYFALFDGYS